MSSHSFLRFTRPLLAGLAMLFLWAAFAPAKAETLELGVQAQAAVPFLSGGVGGEARAELEAVSSQYRLRVVDSTTDGAFASGVQLRLKNSEGRVVLDTRTDGPILLANPPAGRYTLESSFQGQLKTQQIEVPSEGQKRVSQRWAPPPETPKTRVKSNMETRIVIP